MSIQDQKGWVFMSLIKFYTCIKTFLQGYEISYSCYLYIHKLFIGKNLCALAARHSGYRVRLQNIRSLVQIPPGCKLEFIHCSGHNLICIVIVCTGEK
jgi:hypothetical protein